MEPQPWNAAKLEDIEGEILELSKNVDERTMFGFPGSVEKSV